MSLSWRVHAGWASVSAMCAVGEEIINPTAREFLELEQKGKTPIYLSLEHLPDDWHKRIEIACADESPNVFKLAGHYRLFDTQLATHTPRWLVFRLILFYHFGALFAPSQDLAGSILSFTPGLRRSKS